MRDQRLTRARREADAEELCRGLVEPAFLEEIAAGLGLGGRCEHRRVELLGELVRLQQPLPLADVAARTGVSPLLVSELDAGLVGQPLDRLGERDAFDLAQELDGIAADPAPEAVVVALRGPDVERRRLLVVERAQALEDPPPAGLSVTYCR